MVEPQATTLKCEKCGKVVIGITKGQAEYNMKIHKEACQKKK